MSDYSFNGSYGHEPIPTPPPEPQPEQNGDGK